MRDVCRREAEARLGRTLSESELDTIENALKGAMKEVYRQNRGISPTDLYNQAVRLASTRLVEKAVQAKLQTARDALIMSRRTMALNLVPPARKLQEVERWLVDKAELDKSGMQSVESRKQAIAYYAWSQLRELTAMMTNPAKLELFAREVFGEHTGDAEASRAAKAYKDNNARMIDEARKAGMPITPLDNWNFPQKLSSYKPENAQQLADDFYNMTDHGIYRHDNGERYTDQELKDFFLKAAETVITDGASKESSSGLPTFSTSRRGYQKERQIHYKDYASWKYMQDKYGDMTLGQLISGHVNALARDTALTETFGSDYRAGFKKLLKLAYKDAALNASASARELENSQRSQVERYFDFITNDSGRITPAGAAWARRFDVVKNFIVFSHLGGSGINSLGDMAMFSLIGRLSTLPEMQLWTKTLKNTLSKANPQDVEMANRLGLGAQTILADVNRAYRDDTLLRVSANLADFTTKMALLQRFERSKAMAMLSVMHDAVGALTRAINWHDLTDSDKLLMEANGIDEKTYQIWQASEVERGQDGVNTVLMPEHIYNAEHDKIADIMRDEINNAQTAYQDVINRHEAQQVVERDWINQRLIKLNDYRLKLDRMIDRYTNNRMTEGIGRESRIAQLNAMMAHVQTQTELANLLSTENNIAKVQNLLWSVAMGNDIHAAENSASRLVDRFGQTVNRRGYDLGRRLARAEADIAKARRDRDALLNQATEYERKINERFDKAYKKFEAFSKKFTDRITKRTALINEWQKVLGRTENDIVATAKRDAALKLAGMVNREVRMANGGLGVERMVKLGADKNRTGFYSELQRSMTLLKATPLSILQNFIERSGSMSNPLTTRAKYVAISSLMGVMVMNLQNLFKGADFYNPLDTDQEEAGQKAVGAILRGGAFGIFGDVLFDTGGTPAIGAGMSGIVSSPIIGFADDIKSLYDESKNAVTGNENKLGASVIRTVKRQVVPNIFWAKPVLNHYVFEQLQEMVSPGYNAKIAKRMEKNTGFNYWWQPGDLAPNRAPKFSD